MQRKKSLAGRRGMVRWGNPHLAFPPELAPCWAGCRGVIRPVPQPLLIRWIHLSRLLYPPAPRLSTVDFSKKRPAPGQNGCLIGGGGSDVTPRLLATAGFPPIRDRHGGLRPPHAYPSLRSIQPAHDGSDASVMSCLAPLRVRSASLRLRANPVGRCPPWVLPFAPVHPSYSGGFALR